MGRHWKAILALSEVIVESVVLINTTHVIFKSAASKKKTYCTFKIHLKCHKTLLFTTNSLRTCCHTEMDKKHYIFIFPPEEKNGHYTGGKAAKTWYRQQNMAVFFFCEWVQGIQSYHFAESCQDNLMRLGYFSCQLLSKWKLIIMFNLGNSDSMTFKSLNHAS